MSNRTLPITDAIHNYIVNHALREPELFQRLRAETAELPLHEMQIAPEQGQFMALLVELVGARRAIELGTFTGYSALCVASALPADGRLICCDTSAEWTSIAQRYWTEAGLADKIDLRLAPAVQTLDDLLEGDQAGTFDFAFIDADKENSDTYYERLLQLLRSGGLMTIDNALRGGRVADAADDHINTRTIADLNRKIKHDERVSFSLVPIGDGLMLVRKR